MRRHSLYAYIVLLMCSLVLRSQTPQDPVQGITPFGSYMGQDVYSIDMLRGTLNGKIPLASYGQRGHLPSFDYFLTLSNPSYSTYMYCEPFSDTCFVTETLNGSPGVNLQTSDGAQIAESNTVFSDWAPQGNTCPAIDCGYANQVQVNYDIQDSTGNRHPMLYEVGHPEVLYASDGTGYKAVYPAGSNTYNVFGGPPSLVTASSAVVYSGSGISYTYTPVQYPSGGGSIPQTTVIAEPGGNHITIAGDDPASVPQPYENYTPSTLVTDSIGRQLAPVWTSAPLSACPDLGLANQPLGQAFYMALPSKSGGSISYLMCYTGVYVHVAYSSEFQADEAGALVNISNESMYTQPDFDGGADYGIIHCNNIGGFGTLQAVGLPDGSFWKFQYDSSTVTNDGTDNFSTEAYGAITKIFYPTGGTASFSYEQYADALGVGAIAPPNGGPSGGPDSSYYAYNYYQSVNGETRNDAVGHNFSTQYSYGQSNYNNTLNPGTVSRTVIDSSTGNTTVHSFSKFGLMQYYETETDYGVTSNAPPLKSVTTSYSSQTFSGLDPAFNVVPSGSSSSLNGALQSSTGYSYQNLYQGMIWTCTTGTCVPAEDGQHNVYAINGVYATPYVTQTSDGSGTLVKSETRTPLFIGSAGASYLSANLIGLPVSDVVQDGNGATLSSTSYQYDQSPYSNQTIAGNLTGVVQAVSGANSITTHTYFNSQNMPTCSVDGRGHSSSVGYDSTGLYASQVSRGFSSADCSGASILTDLYSFDTNTGLLTSHTDPNSISTSFEYNDPLLRLTAAKQAVGKPDESWTSVSYPSVTSTQTRQDQAAKGDGLLVSSRTTDGFARTVEIIGADGARIDSAYNSLGQVQATSNPYLAGAASVPYTSYLYDALGRMITQCNQDNAQSDPTVCQPSNSYQSSTYSGGQVTAIDENAHTWTRTFDGLGRLAKVVEPNGAETDYTYDAINNLTNVTQNAVSCSSPQCANQPASISRSFTYDSLSRLIAAFNPEAGTGLSCAGATGSSWSICYGYDADGNVTAKNDARGVTTSYSYDALNRLTHKWYSDATRQQFYGYDGKDENGVPVNGGGIYTQDAIGRLSHTSDGISVASDYAYDSMGRLTQKIDCMPSDCSYTDAQSATYDLAGKLTSMTYPDGRVVTQGFDGTGRVNAINYAAQGGVANGSYLAVGSNGYDPSGHLVSATMGNGVAFSASYDNRLRVQGLGYGTVATNTPLWMRAYSWNANSNLGSYTDGITGVQRQFAYDNLNRLTAAQDIFANGGNSGYVAASGGSGVNGSGIPSTPGASGAVPQWTNPDDSNILSDSDTPLIDTWTHGSTTTVMNSAIAPDGTMTARVVTASAGDSWLNDWVGTPYAYFGHTMTASVWLRTVSGSQPINLYLFTTTAGVSGYQIPAWQNVTLTPQWQQFSVSGAVGQSITSLSLQVGGGGSFTSGQSIEMWNPMLEDSGIAGTSVTNFLPYSQRFTSWQAPSDGSTTDNTVTAPDGTQTGATITANSTATDNWTLVNVPNPASYSGLPVTGSIWLKVPSGTQQLLLTLFEGGTSGYNPLGAQTVTLTSDWQRFQVTGTTQSTLTQLALQIGGNLTFHSGQIVNAWGGQMELASTAGPYVPTGATSVTRGTSLTNLLTYSQNFGNAIWDKRQATITGTVAAPDGSASASELTSTGDNAHLEQWIPNSELYDGQTVTASVYLRVPSGTQSFYLMFHRVANGQDIYLGITPVTLTKTWQRFSITATLPSGLQGLFWDLGENFIWTSGVAVDVWGAQLEDSPRAGPYVATSGMPVTSGKEYTNILPSSQILNGPSWVPSQANIASNSDTAPDDSVTATSVVSIPNSSNGNAPSDGYVRGLIPNPSLYDGQTVTASVYLRSTTGLSGLNLYMVQAGDSGVEANCNTYAPVTSQWQRVELTCTLQNGLTYAGFQIGGGTSVTNGQSYELWGPELTIGSEAAPYTPTLGTGTATQYANGQPGTFVPYGLNEAYAYDTYGNILQNGSFTASYTTKNQIVGWPYDAAGNVLTTGYQPIVWDAENRVSTVGGATYFYDGEGNRVEKQGAGVLDTVYFGGKPIARRENGQWTDLIYGPNGLLAEVPQVATGTAEAPVYRMTDHLGTTIGSLDATGAFINPTDYAPFGKTIAGGTADPYKFTGKERDTESGLDNFGARYYGSSMGRWMSPDWDSDPFPVPYASLEYPQTLNLYSYVQNNPLSSRDPDGHASFQDCNGGTQQCWQGDYNGERDCSGSAGCLFWNSGANNGAGEWQGSDPTPPPGDPAGDAFTGFTRMMLSHNSGDFSYGVKTMLGGYAKGLQNGPNILGVALAAVVPILPTRAKLPNLSGKSGAKDIPSWAAGSGPQGSENGKQYASRMMNSKYGDGNWSTSSQEFSQLKKYGDRAFVPAERTPSEPTEPSGPRGPIE